MGINSRKFAEKAKEKTALKKEVVIVASIFFLSLAVRLIYLAESADNPTFKTPVVDAMNYDSLARNLVNNSAMEESFFLQAIFYPLFLAGVYSMSSSSIICAKIIQMFLGSLISVLIYFLGKNIFNRHTGLISAVIIALYGPLIFYDAELLATSWAVLFSVVLIMLFLKAAEKYNVWLYIALGLCGALSVITRPTFLPFFLIAYIFLCYSIFRRPAEFPNARLSVFSIILGFILVYIPTSLLSLQKTGKFTIMPYSGGVNLYIGNNPQYSKTISARPGWQWEQITGMPSKNQVSDNVWDKERFFKRKTIDYALQNPISFARGLINKALRLITSRELPRNVEIYIFGKWSRIIQFSTWKLGMFGFPFGLILPLMVIGLVYNWRKVPAPVGIYFIIYSASLILVFPSARYRAPMIPIISIYSAAGILSIIHSIRNARWIRLAIIAIIVAFVGLLGILPGPFDEEKTDYEAELYYCLGYNMYSNGKHQEAIDHFEKALQIKNDFDDAHVYLGHTLLLSGRLDEAIMHFEKTLELNPDYGTAYSNLGVAYRQKGQYDKSIYYYSEYLRLDSNDPKIYSNLGVALIGAGRIDEAIKSLEKSLKINPVDPGVHNNIAAAFLRKDDVENAVKHLYEAVKIDPYNAYANYILGTIYIKNREIDNAINHFQNALKTNPNWYLPYYQLGMTFKIKGQNSIAIQQYARALGLNKDYPEAHKEMADALAVEGRHTEAVEHYRMAVNLKSNWAEALNNFSWILATGNYNVRNKNEAIRLAQRACELTDYKNHQYLDTLAVAYASAEKFQDAVQAMEKAIKLAESQGQKIHITELKKRLKTYQAAAEKLNEN
ncbi:MAG: tetratricopeptide repeat protein [Planctomycetota bacterium]|jgi:tetratricopeptide (TPR) repeat protein